MADIFPPSSTLIEKRAAELLNTAGFFQAAYALIDLTRLEIQDSSQQIEDFCKKVLQVEDIIAGFTPAAVCLYPHMVKTAHAVLKNSRIPIASVAGGFPAGQISLDEKLEEVKLALNSGAVEIDMVFSRKDFLAGNYQKISDEINSFREKCEGYATLKVILENCELYLPDSSDGERLAKVRLASDLAINAGAHFIKTSTGKGIYGARLDEVGVMLEAILAHEKKGGQRIGLKAAGSVKSSQQAAQYLALFEASMTEQMKLESNWPLSAAIAAWPTSNYFRIGASGLAGNLLAEYAAKNSGTKIAANFFDSATKY